jgi:hypothetical protein
MLSVKTLEEYFLKLIINFLIELSPTKLKLVNIFGKSQRVTIKSINAKGKFFKLKGNGKDVELKFPFHEFFTAEQWQIIFCDKCHEIVCKK